MREIKFRGKRLDNGEWIKGNSIVRLGFGVWICDWTGISVKKSEFFYLFTEVDPTTVGQFTGLHDKNGNEVYEGDISIDKAGRSHIVEYHHGGFWLNSIGSGYTERLHDDNQIEIIANIHDNPELLKTK